MLVLCTSLQQLEQRLPQSLSFIPVCITLNTVHALDMLNIGVYLRFHGPFLAVANSHGHVPAEVTAAFPPRHRETRSLALVQKAHNEAHRKGAKNKSMHLECDPEKHRRKHTQYDVLSKSIGYRTFSWLREPIVHFRNQLRTIQIPL